MVLSPLRFVATTATAHFFIDTSGEWRSWRNDSLQKFSTASERIQGATTVLGLYSDGRLALLSGFFSYNPKTREFEFDQGEGFGLSLGTWSQLNADTLQVEYRFVFADKLVCSDDPNCEQRRKGSPEKTIWKITRGANQNIATIERDTLIPFPGPYVPVQKLANVAEVDSLVASIEKKTSAPQTVK
jgi:hypothetical protein